MAEQSSHDVVNQTLSGGEPLPSDVPASANVKNTAGGDVGETGYTTTKMSYDQSGDAHHHHYGHANNMQDPNYAERDNGASATGPGPVASRALDMNGRTASSDGGEDTGSQGGSESDASRTDSRNPTRAGSLKKPGSFRPVSFNKISLPKAPGAPAAPKAPEKGPQSSTTPLGTPPQSSRPRLVAKSTSGLRDSLSKSGGNAVKPGGSGPDPNQVWNRNRPAQPPSTKNLTDEELKQQYGIHMTSRIQEDGNATESKWADIDDDEDDWAPETIEWTDGTKTNLADPPTPAPQPATLPTPPQPAPRQTLQQEQQQQQPLPPPLPQPPYQHDAKYPGEQPREPLVPMEQPPAAKETLRYAPKPTIIGPNATVLRVGANAEKQAKYANMSRGPNDKQPFSSANHAPPPSKSPWAPLPPVEKASPAVPSQAQLHQQQQPPRQYNRDPQMGEAPPSGPAPSGFPPGGHPHPKEIAADDFNRSWRDMQSGAPRELFNSRSGRYEPVSEQARKGPMRNDQAYRGPSVLQRTGQGEQGGPAAEPSAAFQTHRSGGQDAAGPWTRRRASSNVSGGSGGFARRMSIGRPDAAHHAFDGRRESQMNGMVEPPMPTREFPPTKGPQRGDISPSQQAPGPGEWQSRAAGHPNDTLPGGPMGGPPPQATALMAETAPAPQAPQEDPVAMQERIMKEKRMEARQRRIEQEEKEEAAKRERIRQKLEALGPVPEKPKRKDSLDTNQPESATPTGTTAAAAATDTSQSPPKPPVPEPSGEPKQYGMMKVHHPSTVKKLVGNDRERGPEKSKQDTAAAAVPNGPQEQQLSEYQPQVTPKQPESQLDEQGSQWRNNSNVPGSSYSPWSPSNKFIRSPPSLTNPWKPLSNDRTLGNGIFDPSLGGFPPAKEVPLRGHLGLDQPSSIAPGAQPFPAASRSPQEPATTISPLPSPDVRNAGHDPLSPIGHPGPIGPPSSQHAHWPNEPRPTGAAAWNNFHVAAKREAEEAEKRRNELNTLREVPSTLQVDFSETWRQVRTGDQAGQRQVVGITKPTEPQVNASNILPGLDPVGGLPFPDSSPARPLGGVQPRSSRFFPQATEHVKKLNFEGEYGRSPSPPPPEEVSSHPVFTGNSTRPLVHLPAPKPVVKLPPRVMAEQQQQQQKQQQQPPPLPSAPPTFASMVATPPKNAPAASTATTWQEKINGLFGKKTVPEKRNALEVSSSSKEPLEDVPIPMAAAVSVSFPYKVGVTVVDTVSDEVTAKHFEDTEAIFEDREAGSQPVVRVPNMAPPNAWLAAPPPPPSQPRPKSKNPMQVHSIDPFFFGFDKEPTGNIRVSIRFPGAEIARTLALPKKAASPNPRHHKSGGTGAANGGGSGSGSGNGHGSSGASGFKPKKGNLKQREGHGNVPPKKTSQQPGGANSSSQRNQPRSGSWSRPR